MAETEKVKPSEKEVELDTDDVKAQDVEVKEPEKKEDPKEKINLDLGEVDLGYTEHIDKDKEKAKILIEEEPKKTEPVREEKKVDDLEQVSKTVQKRIDKLTHRYREAERREGAALDFAKGLQKKYDHSLDQYRVSDDKYLKEFDARVDSQREQVKNKLKEAIESQNSDIIMKANDELVQLAVEKEKARIQMAEKEAQLKESNEQAKAQLDQPDLPQGGESMPQPSDKAKEWAQKNTWFGNDKVMTNAAWTLHEDLVSRGVDVEDDNYYNEINRQMKDYFPGRFAQGSTETVEQRAPVQMVASAGRKQQGRRTVKLTKSQVAISKKLGVPLEEYAKYVKEEA